MIWTRQQMVQALIDQGSPDAYKIADMAWPSTFGDEDFQGIEINVTLGPPVGAYGIYRNLRLPGWPYGHDPIVGDAMIIRRHVIHEQGRTARVNSTIFGIREISPLPTEVADVRGRYGPEPQGTREGLLALAAQWRTHPGRFPQVYKDQAWNSMVQYLSDTNPFGD